MLTEELYSKALYKRSDRQEEKGGSQKTTSWDIQKKGMSGL